VWQNKRMKIIRLKQQRISRQAIKWLVGLLVFSALLVVFFPYCQSLYFYKIDHAYPYVASPNYDSRPFGMGINCLVLHSTAQEEIGQTISLFSNPESKVSAHFVVGKDGKVIQMVPIERWAWHAGVSQLNGISNVNSYSIGVEMVNRNDGHDPYPEAQYRAVAGIVRLLRTRLVIPDDHIVSHAKIALPIGRKSDPVGFNFSKLRSMIKHHPSS
jgi:N-acetylmuramoyl-L-alanine amidase